MAIWPFNRKKQDQDNVPTEIQQYYQAEKRERTGLAWLLAAGTLLVTVALVIGLFFAGRWAYRQIAGNDEPESGSSQTETSPRPLPENTNQPSGNTSQTPTQSSPSTPNNSGQTSSTTTPPQSTPAPEVPRTGPELSD